MSVESVDRRAYDGKLLRMQYGSRKRTTKQVELNGLSSWAKPIIGTEHNTFFTNPLRIPKDSMLYGIRKNSYLELEQFGLLVPPGVVVGEIEEIAGRRPLMSTDVSWDRTKLVGKTWFVMQLGYDRQHPMDLTYFIHRHVLEYAQQQLESQSSEQLKDLAAADVFANIPSWSNFGLEMQSSRNIAHRTKQATKPFIPNPNSRDITGVKQQVRNKLWDEGQLWFEWYVETFEIVPGSADPFLLRPDVAEYVRANDVNANKHSK